MSLDSDLPVGFQVKYLGSVSFVRKKRQPLKGIASLQRPLLELYAGARRRGEHQRSAHPLALTQQLEVCGYGLVVAEATARGETVVTKVVTPLSNVVLFAAVRFHARVVRRRVFGAAFVPLACSEGAVASYLSLGAKRRFLVSLSHPSVFACIYRRVSSPTTFECHAFVCATAEDALALANLAAGATRANDALPPRPSCYLPPPRRPAASLDSSCYTTPSDMTPDHRKGAFGGRRRNDDTEEESNSYASVAHKVSSSPPARCRIGRGRYFRHAPTTHHREARALIARCGDRGRKGSSEGRGAPWLGPPAGAPRRMASETRDASTSSCDRAYRECSTMTDAAPPPPQETLAETIDLSSEAPSSSSSPPPSSSSGGWRPLPTHDPAPLVKFTYFGFETYARAPAVGRSGGAPPVAARGRGDATSAADMRLQGKQEAAQGASREVTIEGNGTGKVTINVPYRPDSRTSSARSRTSSVPRGVRTFRKNGHVHNWSSVSQTSSNSSAATLSRHHHHQGAARGGAHHHHQQQQKMLRWSSEDRLPRGFFWSLKRLSIQSLTKAKHKTGKFLSSVKTRLLGGGAKRGPASSDLGSEDSAYDTSEVCLSPSGGGASSSLPQQQRHHRQQPRRQQSWSFHDLRQTTTAPPPRRKQRRRRRKRASSSSDSGVEAAGASDCSAAGGAGSSDGVRASSGVTRVKVEHGMGDGTFQRWSHTNIHDELGYIP